LAKDTEMIKHKILFLCLWFVFAFSSLHSADKEVSRLLGNLANKEISMQYYFWLSEENHYFLAYITANDNFSIWQFTNEKKWLPVHNAGAYDGFPAAISHLSNIEYKDRKVTLGTKTQDGDFIDEIANQNFEVLYYFWKTEGISYLMKPRDAGKMSVWHFTSEKKWLPIHNATKYDGYDGAGITLYDLSFDFASVILSVGDVDPITKICLEHNFCY